MKELVRTGVFVLTIMGLSLGNALPAFATTVTPEVTTPAPAISRSTTKRAPLIDGFEIKVNGGTASPAKAKLGVKVTVSAAAAPAGKIFKGWTSNCDLKFEDSKAKSTTFTMPKHAIVLQAHFEDIQPAESSSSIIVAHSYRNTFKMGEETISAQQKPDGTAVGILNLQTKINRSGVVHAQLAEADLLACIAAGKAFSEKNETLPGLSVELKLPVTPEYAQIVVNFPATAWGVLETENISSFSIASREGAFVFSKAAITAMSTQNRADSKVIFVNDPPSTPSERTIYKFNILYEGQENEASDIGKLVMPISGISLTIPYELKNESDATKVTIMGVDAAELAVKAAGAAYNAKAETVTFPITAYVYYSVGL